MGTIFIIEPDLPILGGLIELLRSLHWPVCGYTRPDQFLEAQHDYTGSFLIVDFDAREVASFKFLRRLQQRNITLPTVLLSSRADAMFKSRARKAGALDVIDKPLVNDLLLTRVRQHFPTAAHARA